MSIFNHQFHPHKPVNAQDTVLAEILRKSQS